MSCCNNVENHGLYAAKTETGFARFCRKCGHTRPATTAEAGNDLMLQQARDKGLAE